MRLLNTTTGRFKEFSSPKDVRYAILSHVWAKPRRKDPSSYRSEQKFAEILKLEQAASVDQSRPEERAGSTDQSESILHMLSPKIQGACAIARKHDFGYIWIDSACIDQSSSAELSEAINSMFEWYRHANICYALLEDVEDDSITRDPNISSPFRHSRWFKRGWTLQELLAPRHVLFVTRRWEEIGTKAELADVIETVTGIRREVLLGETKLEDVPVSQRMHWASKREPTTREEDEAYCLLGIFGIHMSPIYGEGRYAFIRLQEEILRQTADLTILAWGWTIPLKNHFNFPKVAASTTDSFKFVDVSSDSDTAESYLLALSPSDFESHSPSVTTGIPHISPNLDVHHIDFTFTAHGIRAKLPLTTIYDNTIYDKHKQPYRLALLGWEAEKERYIALLLQYRQTSTGQRSISIGARISVGRGPGDDSVYYRFLTLERSEVEYYQEHFRLEEIDIPHRVPPSLRSQVRDESIHACLREYRQETVISLAGWCHPLLKKHGFTVKPDAADAQCTPTAQKLHLFELMEDCDTNHNAIRILVGHCTREECARKGLLYATVIAPRTPLAADAELRSQLPDRPSCHESHIASWALQNCVASKTFPITTAQGAAKTVRLTFRLKSEPGKKYYVLEIELLAPLVMSPVSPLPAYPQGLCSPPTARVDLEPNPPLNGNNAASTMPAVEATAAPDGHSGPSPKKGGRPRRMKPSQNRTARNMYAVMYMKRNPTATTKDFDTAWKDCSQSIRERYSAISIFATTRNGVSESIEAIIQAFDALDKHDRELFLNKRELKLGPRLVQPN